MKAIILAAGRGSRMKDLTDERPKCLVEFHSKPLLEWQLAALREAGVSEIAIVTGYRRDLLSNRGLVEFHNPRWATTNMVSSLDCAQAWLQSESCIVSYSDIFYKAGAVKLLMENNDALAITYDPKWLALWTQRFGDPLLDAETFRMNLDHTLAEIGSKPKLIEEVQGQYMGLLRFTPESWAEVRRIRDILPPQERDRMHMTGTLQLVINEGVIKIKAIPYDGDWGEIDSKDDLIAYEGAAWA